jgi:hypothetical protein
MQKVTTSLHGAVRCLVALVVVSGAFAPAAALADTVVTTYVTKVQEERESTRFTLTEWLRIKERMRMMDLWLALFSDPKKDTFSPELDVSYLMTRGAFTRESDASGGSLAEAAAVTGTQGRAQFWMTNLVSSTFGVRTLNIDLGVEAQQRSAGGAPELVSAVDSADAVDADAALPSRTMQRTVYAGALRLFGKHIQDSMLAVKYGEYRTSGDLLGDRDDGAPSAAQGGRAAGAELAVYLFKWLGAEAQGWAYGDSRKVSGSETVSGSYYDYQGFIEISLLRLTAGAYQEEWTFKGTDDQTTKATEKGLIAGAKLSF